MYISIWMLLLMFVVAIIVALGVAYYFFAAWKRQYRNIQHTSLMSEDDITPMTGAVTEEHFCETLRERLKQEAKDVPYSERFRVYHAIEDLNGRNPVRPWLLVSRLDHLFRVCELCHIRIMWISDKYVSVVNKALKNAGALTVFFIATIAQAVMVALFIALTLPMLGVVRIAPSTATSVKEAVHSLKGYML